MRTAIFSYQNQQWQAHANNGNPEKSKINLVTVFGDKAALHAQVDAVWRELVPAR